jgi:hypothetical protein
MTGVGAAATADAHALGPVSTRSATSSAIYSTQCFQPSVWAATAKVVAGITRRMSLAGHIGSSAPIPAVHATIAQPLEPTS